MSYFVALFHKNSFTLEKKGLLLCPLLRQCLLPYFVAVCRKCKHITAHAPAFLWFRRRCCRLDKKADKNCAGFEELKNKIKSVPLKCQKLFIAIIIIPSQSLVRNKSRSICRTGTKPEIRSGLFLHPSSLFSRNV